MTLFIPQNRYLFYKSPVFLFERNNFSTYFHIFIVQLQPLSSVICIECIAIFECLFLNRSYRAVNTTKKTTILQMEIHQLFNTA